MHTVQYEEEEAERLGLKLHTRAVKPANRARKPRTKAVSGGESE